MYYNHNSNIKCIGSTIICISFEPIYYSFNLDVVLSFMIFNNFNSMFYNIKGDSMFLWTDIFFSSKKNLHLFNLFMLNFTFLFFLYFFIFIYFSFFFFSFSCFLCF